MKQAAGLVDVRRRRGAGWWGRQGLLICLLALAGGCAPQSTLLEPRTGAMVRGEAPKETGKDLFVFLDGTSNDTRSRTNIYRLFEIVSEYGSDGSEALYVDGVGASNSWPVSGRVLGRGMKVRIVMGYEFLARRYEPGDRIFIFGFSRGALQARSLAGLVAFAGLPESKSDRHAEDIFDYVKGEWEDDYTNSWEASEPPLGAAVECKFGEPMLATNVALLGVWDTVPASSFKDYDLCKEKPGFFKKWIPGDRYKTGSYPPILSIAHAVSRDEKRSKFRPLMLCPRISEDRNPLHEMLFPGAHSDVGGGYADSRTASERPSLSNISLNWMIDRLVDTGYEFATPPPPFPENPFALAHWSIGNWPGNFGSECEDRGPLLGSVKEHESLVERRKKGQAPIACSRTERGVLPYPQECPVGGVKKLDCPAEMPPAED